MIVVIILRRRRGRGRGLLLLLLLRRRPPPPLLLLLLLIILIVVQRQGKNWGLNQGFFFWKAPLGHGAVGHLSPSCSEAALRRSSGAWRWRVALWNLQGTHRFLVFQWCGISVESLELWSFWMSCEFCIVLWEKMLHISLVPWRLRALWHSVVVVLCLIEELRWDVCQWKNRGATCLWAHAEDLSIEALKKVTFVWHTNCITTCSACGAAGKTLLCSSARYCSVAKLHRALCADITTTEVVTVSKKEPRSLLVGKGFSSSQI